jgi:hypothetical protein
MGGQESLSVVGVRQRCLEVPVFSVVTSYPVEFSPSYCDSNLTPPGSGLTRPARSPSRLASNFPAT